EIASAVGCFSAPFELSGSSLGRGRRCPACKKLADRQFGTGDVSWDHHVWGWEYRIAGRPQLDAVSVLFKVVGISRHTYGFAHSRCEVALFARIHHFHLDAKREDVRGSNDQVQIFKRKR